MRQRLGSAKGCLLEIRTWQNINAHKIVILCTLPANGGQNAEKSVEKVECRQPEWNAEQKGKLLIGYFFTVHKTVGTHYTHTLFMCTYIVYTVQ